jgi:hypothetical protein
LEGLPVLVLYSSGDSYEIDRIETYQKADFAQNTTERLVKAFRYAEMKALTQRLGAFLPPSPSFHYEAPNGCHYKSFLRVGHAFQSVDALDAAAFWLIPYLTSNSLLLADTSTILSIALNAKRYMVEIGHLNSPHLGHVECLRSYDEPEEDVIRRLIAIRRFGGLLSSVVVLISVSSSGRLVKKILSACKQAGYDDLKTVALYSSPTSESHLPGETFCELDEEFQRYEKQDCELCREASSVVPIEANTYRLEVSAAVSKVRIKATHSNAKEFLEKYRGLNAISVHKDQHDGTRHHMLHVDIAPLFKSEAFLEGLKRITDSLHGKMDVVLSPRHSAALALSTRVAELLNIPILPLDEAELLNLSESTRAQLNTKRILLVDDVVISGARLRGYRNYLLRAGLLNEKSALACLVGVERPPDTRTKQAIIDMVHGPKNFYRVESMLLPNWNKEECPWCWEFDQITRYGDVIRNSKMMFGRYEMLKNTRQGLQSKIFLHWSSPEESAKQLRLGPGSTFGSNLSDVEVFASVASAIQSLRDMGDLNERYTQPIGRVLEPEFYLEGRYYDPVITASIVRAARRCDIRSTLTDADLLPCLRERLESSAATELRPELMLGVAQSKLPTPSLSDMSTWAVEGERGVSSFLKAVLSIKE